MIAEFYIRLANATIQLERSLVSCLIIQRVIILVCIDDRNLGSSKTSTLAARWLPFSFVGGRSKVGQSFFKVVTVVLASTILNFHLGKICHHLGFFAGDDIEQILHKLTFRRKSNVGARSSNFLHVLQNGTKLVKEGRQFSIILPTPTSRLEIFDVLIKLRLLDFIMTMSRLEEMVKLRSFLPRTKRRSQSFILGTLQGRDETIK